MDRIALVTGGGRGIGREVCRVLASQGLTIASADIDVENATRIASELPGRGHAGFRIDVADEASVEDCISTVEDRLGPIAVLVCNAGKLLLHEGRRSSVHWVSRGIAWEDNVRGRATRS